MQTRLSWVLQVRSGQRVIYEHCHKPSCSKSKITFYLDLTQISTRNLRICSHEHTLISTELTAMNLMLKTKN